MTLELSDWLIVALYFVASAGIALIYTRGPASRWTSTSWPGRALPWWLAGTSMVATTFAADTPLVVAGWWPSTAWRATGSGGTAPSPVF